MIFLSCVHRYIHYGTRSASKGDFLYKLQSNVIIQEQPCIKMYIILEQP